MPLCVVYSFEFYDPVRRAWQRADVMATAMAVERMGGVVIHSSARSVDAARVGADGILGAEIEQA